jgi:lysophospholipase L1-like esterase
MIFNKHNLFFKNFFIIVSSLAQGIIMPQENPNYKLQTELYNIYKTKSADIVMLGNSLTRGVDWNELLGREGVVNRGIPSDILSGYKKRLDYIFKLNPKVVFIMGGVNDIYNWTSVDEIFNTYKEVVASLMARKIKVVIQSVIYAGENWGEEWLKINKPDVKPYDVNLGRNKEIDKLNTLLKNFALSNKILFLDINSRLKAGNFLKKDYHYDGIHLNARGYKIWSEEVEKALKELGL